MLLIKGKKNKCKNGNDVSLPYPFIGASEMAIFDPHGTRRKKGKQVVSQEY